MKKIALRGKNGKGLYALIDNEDYIKVKDYKWYAMKRSNERIYATGCCAGKQSVFMHKLIIDCPEGMVRDHKNWNGLDNRKKNLRIVTQSANIQNSRIRKSNTSGYRGVIYVQNNGRWAVQIWYNGKAIHVGSYKIKEDAALAYNDAAIYYHGKDARLNIIPKSFKRTSKREVIRSVCTDKDSSCYAELRRIRKGYKRYGCFECMFYKNRHKEDK